MILSKNILIVRGDLLIVYFELPNETTKMKQKANILLCIAYICLHLNMTTSYTVILINCTFALNVCCFVLLPGADLKLRDDQASLAVMSAYVSGLPVPENLDIFVL